MEKWRISPDKPPEGYKVDYRYVETKSSRLSLLVRPSLRAKAEEVAEAEGISLTELIHRAMAEYIERHEGAEGKPAKAE
jgi:hypothetical protein